MKKLLLLASLSVCTAATCSTVLADDAVDEQAQAAKSVPAAAGGNDAIETIVVTAQRRAERMQDVPITMTAVNGDSLQSAGAATTSDIALVTPGVVITNGSGSLKPFVRGVGTSASIGGIENSVATYIDGVFIESQAGSLLSLTDVERLEVLKGPQGTLFGRNSIGGVIQVITREPSDHFEGNVSLGYANYESFRATTYLSGPIASSLRGSLSAAYGTQNESYMHDTTTGNDIKIDSDVAVRGKLAWALGEQTTVTAAADYFDLKGALPVANAIPGALRAFAPPRTGSVYNSDSDDQPKRDLFGGGGMLQFGHDFAGMTLTSITAYRETELDNTLDGDQGPTHTSIAVYAQIDKQFSEELQLASTGSGPLQGIVGLYYLDASTKLDPISVVSAPPLPVSRTDTYSEQTTRSIAGYGQATYDFGQGTKLTAGLRYTDEKRAVGGKRIRYAEDGSVIGTTIAPKQEKDAGPWTYRLALDHHFTDDVMGFLSYSKGFKSGGFSGQNPLLVGYDPETLIDYEAGVKADFLDSRLRLNVSGFYYDYTNMQVVTYIVPGTSQVYNGAAAEMYGVDADLEYRATDRLTLALGAEALHARFTDFPKAVIYIPQPNGTYRATQGSATGNDVPNAPDATINARADYSMPLPSSWRADLNLSYLHNTGFTAEPDERLKQPAYDLVNSSVTFSDADDHWNIGIWGKNLLNDEVSVQLLTQSIVLGAAYAPPRTYGITVTRNF